MRIIELYPMIEKVYNKVYSYASGREEKDNYRNLEYKLNSSLRFELETQEQIRKLNDLVKSTIQSKPEMCSVATQTES